MGHYFLVYRGKSQPQIILTCRQHLYWPRKKKLKVKCFPVINSLKFRESPIYLLAAQKPASHQMDANEGAWLGGGGGEACSNLGAAAPGRATPPFLGLLLATPVGSWDSYFEGLQAKALLRLTESQSGI